MTDINSRYGLNPAHSEVIEASKTIKPCDTLDMGCGTGRNALFLSQLGFNVTAIDSNSNAIQTLEAIIAEEGITNLQPQVYDINEAAIQGDYGFVVCTVTLMFLNPNRVETVIADMQERTLAGGYNLIVCAMSTEACPCPVNFPFVLKEGQLSKIYKGWELIKYNEELGTMHNGAQLQFATMLARKP